MRSAFVVVGVAVVVAVAATVGRFVYASPAAEEEGPFPIGLADRVEAFYQNAKELRFQARLSREVPGMFGRTVRTIRYHADVVMRRERLSLFLFEGKDFVAYCAWEYGQTTREWTKPGVDGCLYGVLQRSWLTAEDPHWKRVVDRIRHGRLLSPAEFQGRPCSRVAFYRSWSDYAREDVYWIDDESGRIVGWLYKESGTTWGRLTGYGLTGSTVENWYFYKEEGDPDEDDE